METRRTPAEKDQDHIRQRAQTQAAGARQGTPPTDAACFTMPLELLQRYRRKSLLLATAAAAITDEHVTVLNPNLLRDTVGLRNLSQRSLSFFFNDTASTEIYTLSLHDALPI